MNDLSASDLKPILHSKRANLYCLEHCRVMQKDGRVLYLSEAKKTNLYFNIPIANTTVILLGTGTSVTQAAVRMLAQAGVLLGFCSGGGTPLYMGNEIEWFTSQSVYRPTDAKHIKNVFKNDELYENSVCSILEYTVQDDKNYKVKFYNLDAIISVGYRVNSSQATLYGY